MFGFFFYAPLRNPTSNVPMCHCVERITTPCLLRSTLWPLCSPKSTKVMLGLADWHDRADRIVIRQDRCILYHNQKNTVL